MNQFPPDLEEKAAESGGLQLSYGSVCSGIEAASVAWEPLGWRPQWFSEIEKFPSSVLAHRWPAVKNHGDMSALPDMMSAGELNAPDILVGGTPCQAFSVAGARDGLENANGQLAIKYVELADAIDQRRVAAGLPECITVWENVLGVLSSKDNAFGAFLGLLCGEECELEPPRKKWANIGYVHGPTRSVAWRVLDAQYFGVAQRRRRLFVVATARTDANPAKVLFESKGVRRTTEPSSEGQERCPPTVDGGTVFRFRRTDSYVEDVTSSTLAARDFKEDRDLVVTPDGRVRGYTPEEFEMLQGFLPGHTDVPKSRAGVRKKAVGNSMAVPCMKWIGQRIEQHLKGDI